jgi:hypothetical protein
MSRRALSAVLFAAFTLIVVALMGAGCGDDPPNFFEDGVFDAGRDAIDKRNETGTGSETGTEGGADTGVPATFNISAADSTGRLGLTVTFDAPPDAAQAVVLANYAVPGLTLSGTPTLSGNVVTLVTSAQVTQSYTLTVSGVTRASDGAPLTGATKVFTGSGTFSVTGAAAPSAKVVKVTFDAIPTTSEANNPLSYTVPGLTVSAALVAGKVVTLTTTAQTAQSYALTVAGVTRSVDNEPLTVATANFTGRTPFNVASAQSTNPVTLTVTFDAAPNTAMATTLANYAVPGLTLSGTPVLAGNTVTLKTSAQLGQAYTVTVSNVTRASDAEPLDVKAATFNGTAVLAPTVTNVVVTSTLPNNGTIPYNTGTSTVTITGTDFLTVSCVAATMGVKLDDLDGVGVAVNTPATACTVDSDTQITATLPRGIRTNAATGWNVRVTNTIGTNATSAVPFVPRAGLLISEVYIGSVGGADPADREFIEVYNPTATAIDTSAAGLALKMHIRNGGGTNTQKPLALVTTGIVPSHGFLLIVSTKTDANDAWYAKRDYTYSAELVGNGGVYISLSITPNTKVLDKVGWGTQPANGFEGTATLNLAAPLCIERLPAGGAGHATDTDVNSSDFGPPTAVITPRGIADGAQP